MQSNLDNQKSARKETIESQLIALEKKVIDSEKADDDKFKLLTQQIAKLQDGIKAESNARTTLIEKKNIELKQIENNLNVEINQIKIALKNSEIRLDTFMEEKTDALEKDLAKEKEIRETNKAHSIQKINDSIAKIEEDIDNELKLCEENSNKLSLKIGEQTSKINEALTLEKNTQDEAHGTMFRMVDDMRTKLFQEIEQERKERAETEDTLIKLLEDTCIRVEKTFNTSVSIN
jgi:hypothetical protein